MRVDCVCLGPRIPPLRRSTHLPVRLSNNLFALHAINLNIDIRTSVNIFQALSFAFENGSHMYETDFRLGPVRNIFSSLFANHNMKLITISKQVRRKAAEVKIKICFNFLLSFMFNIKNPNCEMFYTKKGN